MFNEEAVIPLFVERIRPILEGLGDADHRVSYELLCIDDGSGDGTAQRLLALAERWPQLRVLRLLRNSGHQAALTAGMLSARGRLTVTLDADLQDPPELIPEMLAVMNERQVDVVYGVRADRSSDSFAKRCGAAIYYGLMRRLSGPQLPGNAGDFRMVSRRVIDALSALPEHGRVYRLVIPWFGFPSAEVSYARQPRIAGVSKYPVRKMVALTLDSVTSFSALPLRLATWAGLIGTSVSAAAAVWSILGYTTGHTVPGWASLLVTVSLLSAMQLLCLGLLGEYVARLFVTSQGRPSYLIGYDSASPTNIESLSGADSLQIRTDPGNGLAQN